jgi:antitoxin component YwqK of YwqJK toxin-antitoxin module
VIYKDGKRHGMMTVYYPDGAIQGKIEFFQDTPINTSDWYHPNGVLAVKYGYKKGKVHGTRWLYYDNGKTERVEILEYGEKNGLEKGYYPTGELFYRLNFKNNQRTGKYKRPLAKVTV